MINLIFFLLILILDVFYEINIKIIFNKFYEESDEVIDGPRKIN